jgi:hypothetical protein
MAKMFYTLDEVSSKLGRSEDEIKEMVRTGQIQEFRDRDKLMFKVEQIDLLAEPETSGEVHLDLDDPSGSGISLKDDSGLGLADSGFGLADSGLGLADSGEGIGLADSGAGVGLGDQPKDAGGDFGPSDSAEGFGLADSGEGSAVSEGLGLADSREGTGVSVFDTDHGGEALEQTQSEDFADDELGLDSVGSGSGLLDLTRESDDTSLGAELLEEVYSSEEGIEIPAAASGLFEAAAAERPAEDMPAPAVGGSGSPMPMLVEVYDGTGSGLGAGLLIGAVAALVCVAIVAIVGVSGATSVLATKIASTPNSVMIWTGGLLGVTIVIGLIGLFIGKASE